jgi:hypothetical protein
MYTPNTEKTDMRKEIIGARIAPDLKREILEEAEKNERDASWLVRKLIQKGWEAYKAESSVQRSEAA